VPAGGTGAGSNLGISAGNLKGQSDYVDSWTIHCDQLGEDGLVGEKLGVIGLAANQSSAIPLAGSGCCQHNSVRRQPIWHHLALFAKRHFCSLALQSILPAGA